MKVVDTLITKFVEKQLQKMEELTDDIQQEKGLTIIGSSKQDLKNQEIYKKLFAKQTLLSFLKIF